MKPLTRATRVIAVAAAGIVTSALFSTVVLIAEPQRSALIARNAAQPQAVAASAALQMADACRDSAGRNHQPWRALASLLASVRAVP